MNGKVYPRSVKEKRLDMSQQCVAKDIMFYALAVNHVPLNNLPARKQVCYAIQNVTGAI
jgi:hypothetical protein